MDNEMKKAIASMKAGERITTTPFPRATRRKPVRNRVRNNTWMTAHPAVKATRKAMDEAKKLRGLLKNTSKAVINSMPEDKSAGWLRKIFA